MGESFQGLEILIWAAIAGFVIFRLRSVLGRRTGNERPPRDSLSHESSPPGSTKAEASDTVISLSKGARGQQDANAPQRQLTAQSVGIDPNSALAETLSRIRVADRYFEPAEFVDGAATAYRIIIHAFASGDEAELKPLLSPDVMADFRRALSARAAKGETVDAQVTDIVAARITDAELNGTIAELTIRFESDIVRCTRDSENRVIDGDPTDPSRVTDVWTFSRDVESDDPNWMLVATSTEH